MCNSVPEWINILAQDVYRLIQKYDALGYFQEKVNECILLRLNEIKKYTEWESKRKNHFQNCLNKERLLNENAGPPEEGWRWGRYPLHKCENGKDVTEVIAGWVPPELSSSAEPTITHLLPLSDSHVLNLAEKYTVLAAIYDRVRRGTDQIPPWEWPDLTMEVSSKQLSDAKKNILFESLRDSVTNLSNEDKGWLRIIFEDVEKDLSRLTHKTTDSKLKRVLSTNLVRATMKHIPYFGQYLYDIIYGVDGTGPKFEKEKRIGTSGKRNSKNKRIRWYRKIWVQILGLLTFLVLLTTLVLNSKDIKELFLPQNNGGIRPAIMAVDNNALTTEGHGSKDYRDEQLAEDNSEISVDKKVKGVAQDSVLMSLIVIPIVLILFLTFPFWFPFIKILILVITTSGKDLSYSEYTKIYIKFRDSMLKGLFSKKDSKPSCKKTKTR